MSVRHKASSVRRTIGLEVRLCLSDTNSRDTRKVTWQRVAEIARTLAETEKTTSWGKPSFKVRGKTLARMSTRHEGTVLARCDRDEFD